MFIVLPDYEPPEFGNCPTSPIKRTTNDKQATAIIDIPRLTASDNSKMNISIMCDVMPGFLVTIGENTPGFFFPIGDSVLSFLFPIGKRTVTCIATDYSGNERICSFQVEVIGKLSFYH